MSLKEFDYRCIECKRVITQYAREEPPSKCPHCGGKMARMFGTNNIIYKGYEFVGPTYHEKRDR